MSAFKYSRKVTVLKKDEEGKPIPVMEKVVGENQNPDEVEATPVPGKFETEELWKRDYINLDLFIRSHELEDGRVIVLLHDGHEETTKVAVGLKNPKKGPVKDNIVSEKQVQWVQSEIVISLPEEVELLYKKLDAML
jgi:hypothetical protein